MVCLISSANPSASVAAAPSVGRASEYPLQTIPHIFAEAFMVVSELFTMTAYTEEHECTPWSPTIIALSCDFNWRADFQCLTSSSMIIMTQTPETSSSNRTHLVPESESPISACGTNTVDIINTWITSLRTTNEPLAVLSTNKNLLP